MLKKLSLLVLLVVPSNEFLFSFVAQNKKEGEEIFLIVVTNIEWRRWLLLSALLGHGWFSFLRLTSGLWIEVDGKKLVCSSFCGQFLTLKDDFRNLLADRFFFILFIPSRCFEKLGDTELVMGDEISNLGYKDNRRINLLPTTGSRLHPFFMHQ